MIGELCNCFGIDIADYKHLEQQLVAILGNSLVVGEDEFLSTYCTIYCNFTKYDLRVV